MIELPFNFKVEGSDTVFFAEQSTFDENSVHVSWVDAYGFNGSATHSHGTVNERVASNLWVVEPGQQDLRTQLKMKLFTMRIADMEQSIQTLKREFNQLKGSH